MELGHTAIRSAGLLVPSERVVAQAHPDEDLALRHERRDEASIDEEGTVEARERLSRTAALREHAAPTEPCARRTIARAKDAVETKEGTVEIVCREQLFAQRGERI